MRYCLKSQAFCLNYKGCKLVKVKKIMSGMLAGVVAVSYSMVYQLPAAAVDTAVCKNFKLSAFGVTGFNLAACGVITNE